MFELKNITTYQAGVYHARAFRVIKELKNRILKPYGLTMMQWEILGLVADSGSKGVRITALAKELDTTQAFVTTTINMLESKNWVTRVADTSDSRARDVVLNPKHAKLVKKIEADVRDALRRELYSKVTPQELKTYINVLAKFSQ